MSAMKSKGKRNVHAGLADLGEGSSVQDEKVARAFGPVQDHTQQDAVILLCTLGIRDKDRLAG